jgi:hypothetical protein
MLSHEALAIARNAEPASSSRSGIRHFEGSEYGALAEVRADDYAKDAIVGRLDFLDTDEIPNVPSQVELVAPP